MSVIFELTDREKMLGKKHQLWMINGFIKSLEKRKENLWKEIVELEKKLNEGMKRSEMKKMTTDEISEYVIVPVKRHINMGERTFQNAETRMQKVCGSTISEQQDAQRELREALNTWEPLFSVNIGTFGFQRQTMPS